MNLNPYRSPPRLPDPPKPPSKFWLMLMTGLLLGWIASHFGTWGTVVYMTLLTFSWAAHESEMRRFRREVMKHREARADLDMAAALERVVESLDATLSKRTEPVDPG